MLGVSRLTTWTPPDEVQFYFLKTLRLYEARYVSRRFLHELAAVDGINILYDIIVSFESV